MRAGLPLVTAVLATLAAAHLDSPTNARRHAVLNRAVEDDEVDPEPVIEDVWGDSLTQDYPSEDETDDIIVPYVVDRAEDFTPRDESGLELSARAVKKTKACLAWTNEMASGLKNFQNKGVFGMYTWSEWCPPDSKKFGIPCFPMLWGDKNAAKFKKAAVKGYATYALGMNEVNIAAQSQMNPGRAAYMWRTYMLPLTSKGYKLISPSTANGKTAATWMKEFFKQCPDCKKSTHAVAAHYYGTDPQKFISYMTDLHNQLGMNIWVTEIGCQDYSGKNKQCSQSQADNYLNTVISWMDRTPWIEVYCWYGMFHKSRVGVSAVNGMFNANATLNSFGRLYLSKAAA